MRSSPGNLLLMSTMGRAQNLPRLVDKPDRGSANNQVSHHLSIGLDLTRRHLRPQWGQLLPLPRGFFSERQPCWPSCNQDSNSSVGDPSCEDQADTGFYSDDIYVFSFDSSGSPFDHSGSKRSIPCSRIKITHRQPLLHGEENQQTKKIFGGKISEEEAGEEHNF